MAALFCERLRCCVDASPATCSTSAAIQRISLHAPLAQHQRRSVRCHVATAVEPLAQSPEADSAGTMKLTRRPRNLNWFKWEERVYERALREAQTEESPGGQGTDNTWFFSMWDSPPAHQAWLEDQVRLSAYEGAIFACRELLEDKVVLDLGCGYGVLSMLCAQAGARHVYGVDASAAADTAAKVVAANGLAGRVTIVKGRAEQVTLPVTKVDVIICDWMGAFLLHGSMLPALLHARDRWLAPGGIILPDRASLHLMAVDDRQHLGEAKKFWGSRRAGLDLSAALGAVVRAPRLDTVARRTQVATNTQRLLQLDLYQASLQDCLTWRKPFKLEAQREQYVSALLAYFTAEFTCRGALDDPPVLTTHPMEPATSWLQTIFSFPRAIPVQPGQALSGTVACRPVEQSMPGHMLDVDVELAFQGLHARVGYHFRRPL